MRVHVIAYSTQRAAKYPCVHMTRPYAQCAGTYSMTWKATVTHATMPCKYTTDGMYTTHSSVTV